MDSKRPELIHCPYDHLRSSPQLSFSQQLKICSPYSSKLRPLLILVLFHPDSFLNSKMLKSRQKVYGLRHHQNYSPILFSFGFCKIFNCYDPDAPRNDYFSEGRSLPVAFRAQLAAFDTLRSSSLILAFFIQFMYFLKLFEDYYSRIKSGLHSYQFKNHIQLLEKFYQICNNIYEMDLIIILIQVFVDVPYRL